MSIFLDIFRYCRYKKRYSDVFISKMIYENNANHNSASGMFVNLNTPSFGELLRKYVYNFKNRLEISDNVIICRIYLSHFLLQSGIWGWWRDILSP